MKDEQAERGIMLAKALRLDTPKKIFHLVCSDCGDYFGLARVLTSESWCQKCIARYLNEEIETDIN